MQREAAWALAVKLERPAYALLPIGRGLLQRLYYPDVEPALRELDKRELRERILPPLLQALGFVDVRHRHGPREEGKDLLAWRLSVIDTHDWIGFVVKRGDLNAQVTSSAGIRTVLHQVEQVLNHEVTDPLTPRSLSCASAGSSRTATFPATPSTR